MAAKTVKVKISVLPKKYAGYDEKDKEIVRLQARDVNEFLDIAGVEAQLNNINTTIETEINNICKKLKDIITNDSEDDYVDINALVIEGTNMSGVLEDIITELKSLPEQMQDSLSDIPKKVGKKIDEIQTDLNNRAQEEVSNTKSVVTVREI